MKKILFIALAFATACQAQKDGTCNVQFNLSNQTDTLELVTISVDRQVEKRDTLVATDGKISYTANLSETKIGIVTPFSAKARYQFYFIPGENCVMTLKENGSCEYGGSKVYQEMNAALAATDSLEAVAQTLVNEYYTRLNAGEDKQTVGDEIQPRYAEVIEQVMAVKKAYIAANPESDAAAMLVAEMPKSDFENLYALLGDKAKNGVVGNILNRQVELFAKARAREEAMKQAQEKVKDGVEAPDFTLPTIDGGQLTLSSLRGKYVVIDFWGSWCGWCIKGMPDMKKYYEKYAGKFEIVGVDCGDSDDKWKAAVEKHQLPWLHVKNLEGDADVTAKYAVQGYPTKVIIAPDGKIFKTIVGEDPEFYTTLDSVLQ